MLRECPGVVVHVHMNDTSNRKASVGSRYVLNLSGTRGHRRLNRGRGEVPQDEFFGALTGVAFDGIMTARVFAWEDKAERSSAFTRRGMQHYVKKY
jgi:myo-inositol catabolism protein IolH